MARAGRKFAVAVVAVLGVWSLKKSSTFVPPAGRSALRAPLAGAAGAAALVGASPAFADEIGDAAKVLSDKAYPFLKDVDWGSYLYNLKPGPAGSAADWAKAVDKAIVMGASMDPTLLEKGVQAHHKAIGTLSPNNLMISKGDFEAINAAIGRMVASVPESQTMDVYNSFGALVSPEVPKYLMSTVKEADARAAYDAFMEFKDVVKAHPITPTVPPTPAALEGKLGAIDAAATKLSEQSYNFIKDIDWTSDLWQKPFPGFNAYDATKAIDKALVMGASMDGKLLKEAAEAHHKALGSMDDKLVTSLGDYTAVNAALGKAVASVPQSQVMDVYNSFTKLVGNVVPNKLISGVNPVDAVQAYTAFLGFKDVVKAAQR